jgi:Zn-dependent protease with chaperone function
MPPDTTTFWDQQDHAKARTGRLLFVFTLALTTLVLSIYLPLSALINIRSLSLTSFHWLWNPTLFLVTASPILLIIGIGTLVEFIKLSKGGRALAKQLKAQPLTNPASPSEKILTNVVEEIAIASGIAPPPIFILDKAPDSINALVAGNTTQDAAIILTQGCLTHLSRQELQAVVAHEFSHIFNGDMKLNLRVAALVFGITSIAIVGGEIILPDDIEGGCITLAVCLTLGLPLLILGLTGALFGKLIQRAVCREREYLADASAVQFTRHPDALASALTKIYTGSSRIKISAARAADHLFIANCRKPRWFTLFRTHPPLKERIQRIQSLTLQGPPENSPLNQALKDAP